MKVTKALCWGLCMYSFGVCLPSLWSKLMHCLSANPCLQSKHSRTRCLHSTAWLWSIRFTYIAKYFKGSPARSSRQSLLIIEQEIVVLLNEGLWCYSAVLHHLSYQASWELVIMISSVDVCLSHHSQFVWVRQNCLSSVSYTHLTLPTKLEV